MSKYDCSLTSLNLSSNPISKKGQQTLAEMIANNRTLKHLSLNSCSFDIQTLISVCAYLYENQTLQTLLLDRPILTKTKENDIADHFHRILTRQTNLTSLSFKYHNINDKGACLFAEALNINHSLISLNLECNKIGVMGAEALASNLIIKQNRSLQFLGLSFNEINDNGAIALAEVSLYILFFFSLFYYNFSLFFYFTFIGNQRKYFFTCINPEKQFHWSSRSCCYWKSIRKSNKFRIINIIWKSF